jgi:hypothetical protein
MTSLESLPRRGSRILNMIVIAKIAQASSIQMSRQALNVRIRHYRECDAPFRIPAYHVPTQHRSLTNANPKE